MWCHSVYQSSPCYNVCTSSAIYHQGSGICQDPGTNNDILKMIYDTRNTRAKTNEQTQALFNLDFTSWTTGLPYWSLPIACLLAAGPLPACSSLLGCKIPGALPLPLPMAPPPLLALTMARAKSCKLIARNTWHCIANITHRLFG